MVAWLVWLVVKLGLAVASSGSNTRYSRYLLYTVNPGEGFNLARDVYLRMAMLTQRLNQEQPWTLVLPEFGNPHWHYSHYEPFERFFDLAALSQVSYLPEVRSPLNVYARAWAVPCSQCNNT